MRTQSLLTTLSISAVCLSAAVAPGSADAQRGDLGAGPYFIGSVNGNDAPPPLEVCPAGDATVMGASASHDIPAFGVVTEFQAQRIGAPGAPFSFRLGQRDGGGWKMLATVPAKLDATGGAKVAVRIPVAGQEYVGISRPAGSQVACMRSSYESLASSMAGVVPDGTSREAAAHPDHSVPVVAKWEGDADRDGFGDATQDKCLFQTGAADGCAVAAPAPAPAACTIPRVVGLKLDAAKKRLAAAGCATGSVKRVKGARGKLVVRSQSWPANTTAPAGTKVALKLGAARR